jgi:hypothetical protein
MSATHPLSPPCLPPAACRQGSFAGPVIHLHSQLTLLAQQLLRRARGKPTVLTLAAALRAVDDYEQGVLAEQVELALLFGNDGARRAIAEFSTVAVVQVCVC